MHVAMKIIRAAKNTASAERLAPAFVWHLWVLALSLAGPQEPCSVVSCPSGSEFGLAGRLQSLCALPRLFAQTAVASAGVRSEVGATWVCLGGFNVTCPCAQSCKEL